jgi:ABC-type transporter Mla subunit MlaD
MEGKLSKPLEELNRAIEKLESAVDARLEREGGLVEAEAEVQRMGADRARLADSLDSAVARSQQLESANREVSRRLVDAMESIRAVLERQPE